MDLESASRSAEPVRRRRGALLEDALLTAAWEDLVERGYGAVSMDSIAERAGTSRTVLYRRWPSRADLVVAAIQRHFDEDAIVPPDTGSLREDMIEVLRAASAHRGELIGLVSVLMTEFFSETESTPAALRERLIGRRRTSVDVVLENADARGEIELALIPPRVRTAAFDLFRHEALMTLGPVSDDVIRAIVDDVFLPLVLPTARPTAPVTPRRA